MLGYRVRRTALDGGLGPATSPLPVPGSVLPGPTLDSQIQSANGICTPTPSGPSPGVTQQMIGILRP